MPPTIVLAVPRRLELAGVLELGVLVVLFSPSLHYPKVQFHANPVLMHALGVFEQHGPFVLDRSDLQKTRLGVSVWF